MKMIGIIGTGTMGGGIAMAASQVRCDVLFQNRRQESVDRGLRRIQKDRLAIRKPGEEAAAEINLVGQAGCHGFISRLKNFRQQHLLSSKDLDL